MRICGCQISPIGVVKLILERGNLLHYSRNLAPDRRITHMSVVMLPENALTLNQRNARHLPGIANG